MRSHKILAMLLICFGTGLAQSATPATTIDISSFANTTWCSTGEIIGCSTFPFGLHRYNRIPFLIPGNTAGTANNFWSSEIAAGGPAGTVSVTIPINVANVWTVYTLMNTLWGSTQPGLISITFTGSAGATWTFQPVGNVNVRDYNNDDYTDSILCHLPDEAGKSTTINAWTNNGAKQRLDEQIYELPASFRGQTLVSMTITDSGSTDMQRSFLAALTVSTDGP
jgi:hypothetical protein